jgi:hypothetical protein
MGTDDKTLARQDWVQACAFDAAHDAELLARIGDKIKENSALGVKSYVLLDLDSTLYEVGPRTRRILLDAAASLGDNLPAPVRAAFDQLEAPGYSLEDTWRALGLCLENAELGAARGKLHALWRQAFFSNDYLDHDVAYVGASQFAVELHALGADLVYLTGRDAPAMRDGTLRCLARDGFPLGDHTHLRMKPSREVDDIDHKVGAAKEVARDGVVVASLENEPRNFAALFDAFPDALHVFVDTVCSDKPAPIVRGAYRLSRST